MKIFHIGVAFLLLTIGLNTKANDEQSPVIIGSINSATTWYWAGEDHAGLEYSLAVAFSEFAKTPVELVVFDDYQQMIEAFNRGEIDIMTGDVDLTQVSTDFTISPEYRIVSSVVIRHDSSAPWDERQYAVAAAGSAIRLDHASENFDGTTFTETSGLSPFDLIKQVNRNPGTYAIIDEVSFSQFESLFPRVKAQSINALKTGRRWVSQVDILVAPMIELFFSQQATQRLIETQIALEQPRVKPIEYTDARSFTYLMRSRLPRYRSVIQHAATESGLPFSLIAATSFQESHWNPNATSPTGVRGFMMLTNTTARELGVSDRLDLRQSAVGGAVYLRTLYDRLPKRFSEENRIAFALASYNIGRGHVEDARILAQRHGFNPDNWDEVKPFIIQLEQPDVYVNTKNGFARGRECVTYVENILQFEQLIAWQDQVENRFIAGDTRYALSP
jgi:membrane-bound lytic murein transglycosylase F